MLLAELPKLLYASTVSPESRLLRGVALPTGSKPTIMVSSSVYGIESLLNVLYSMLDTYGYTVWMSHLGTLPTNPALSNRETCLQAVRDCDLFLGIINGRYGSGITHAEIKEAVTMKKPSWFVVHHNIVVARQLLAQYRFDDAGVPRSGFKFGRTSIMDNIAILEMYEDALQLNVPLANRTGHWVQDYMYDDDIKRYIQAQFSDVDRIVELLNGTSSATTGTGSTMIP